MVQEAPIQIDLSDETSWDKIDDSLLTSDEKRVLREQFWEDTDAIISLTARELEEFKEIMKSEIPEIVSDELDDFVKEQVEEWISMSDFLSEDSETAEKMNMFESAMREWLFGENGIFKLHEISGTAQDRFCLWFSLSMIHEIHES